MDDIVALRVRLTNGEKRYFLTWGRVFDPVDPRGLCDAVWGQLDKFALGGDAARIDLCDSLREAAEAPYFFESFFAMCQKKIPFGDEYLEWATRTRSDIEQGRGLYFLGS